MILKYSVAFLLLCSEVKAFSPLHAAQMHRSATATSTSTSSRSTKMKPVTNQHFHKLFAQKGNADERKGMTDAFESLNDLSAMDFADDEEKVPVPPSPPSSSSSSSSSESTEEEIKKYKEMYEQLEKDDGGVVYNDILGEMGMTPSSSGKGFGKDTTNSKSSSFIDDDDSKDQLIASPQDTDEFMAKALEEAMDEVKKQNDASGIDPKTLEDSILNDEEIMKEINAVFDRANDRLMEGIKEIREEQATLTKATSERRSKALEEEEQRLREAEGSVSRLVEKVKQETLEVEKASRELEELSIKLGQDPLMKAADLKKGGIIKQSALVGAVLFSLRSVGDIAMMGGPDGASHTAAALVQGIIALACAAYLLFF